MKAAATIEGQLDLLELLDQPAGLELVPLEVARERARRRWLAPTVDTQWGTITNWTPDPTDPGRATTVYLGTGHTHHLNHSPVPLFISATALYRYKGRGDRWPVTATGKGGWALDSGAYTALAMDTKRPHPWHFPLDEFGGMVLRMADDIGRAPDFAAIPDMPCEPMVRARTGFTSLQHAEFTVDAYCYLAEEFPWVEWLPVLQGWEPDEYEACERMYLERGVDLAGARRVGLGSICRRGSETEIAALVERFAGRGYRLHGFGVSIKGLRRIGHLLASTDSQAWSDTARKEHLMLPGCEHWSKPDKVTGARRLTDCRNCFRYALAYREEMIEAIRLSARQAKS